MINMIIMLIYDISLTIDQNTATCKYVYGI